MGKEFDRIDPGMQRWIGRQRVFFVGTAPLSEKGHSTFGELRARFDPAALASLDAGIRSIVHVDIHRIADSCGYSVPLMSYEGERPHQKLWVDKRIKQDGAAGVMNYARKKNAVSIDHLPAVDLKALPDFVDE